MESRTRRSSLSEQKEIEKYIKFFAIKALQCVVQSRVGTQIKTKCNPAARGLDWFNVSIVSDELASNKLQSKIRDLFGKKIPGLSHPVCLDVILKTTDGNYTVLESWQISTSSQHNEGNTRNHFSVYNKFSVLLRSVISSSRLLPSYRLSRKNENDFLLFCKIHTDIYELHHYELHNKYSIGSVSTPSGKLSIKVLYRNKIWLSGSIHPYTYDIIDTEALLLLTEVENKRETFFQSVDMLENEIAIAASDISVNPQVRLSNSYSSPVRDNSPKCSSQMVFSGPSVGHIGEESRPIAAFVEPSVAISDLENLDLPALSEVPPFLSLLTGDNSANNTSHEQNIKQNSEIDSTDAMSHKNKANDAVQRTAEAVGFEDDFVLVELRPAFCTDDNSVGTLYRYCQSPTSLDMFASLEREDNECECIDLDTQLERYQRELKEFQDFFKILS